MYDGEEISEDYPTNWIDLITNGVGTAWAIILFFWIAILLIPIESEWFKYLGTAFFFLMIAAVVFWPVTLFGLIGYVIAIFHLARKAAREGKPWCIGLSGSMVFSALGLLAALFKYRD